LTISGSFESKHKRN